MSTVRLKLLQHLAYEAQGGLATARWGICLSPSQCRCDVRGVDSYCSLEEVVIGLNQTEIDNNPIAKTDR